MFLFLANCKNAWIRESTDSVHFKAHDCIITGNTNMAAFFGSGPAAGVGPSSTDFLILTNVRTEGKIEIEMDQSKRNYLQLVAGSFGADLKAGLFK